MKEKIFCKANISLFVVAIVFTVVTGLVCHLCGADRVTTIACSPLGGVLSVMGIGLLFEIEKMEMPVGPEAGILGIVAGTIISLLVF